MNKYQLDHNSSVDNYLEIIEKLETQIFDLKKKLKNKDLVTGTPVNYCDLKECKQNINGICRSLDPILCPKNNEQSIYEKPELLKKKRERPQKLLKPEDLNYGKSENEQNSDRKEITMFNEDVVPETPEVVPVTTPAVESPKKRGRGRPKGSLGKKKLAVPPVTE